MSISASRYHDISCGHIVSNHESKCRFPHGHNYRIHFEVSGELDNIGRVLDFSVIKEKLCLWLEENFDHKFLIWEKHESLELYKALGEGIKIVPFNPTAENIAKYLIEEIAPGQLMGTGCILKKCIVEETRKCYAIVESK